ncbi:MAG: hypothetical protein LBP73_08905 [Clostridiales Family XIII bacterium]|nr:hypothetical protein [Clostridiales Family XIII bacterium]
MTRTLDARFAARAFDGRAVFLFGHCNATEEMADYLLSRDVAPAAILDNNPSKQGLAYGGIPIRPPEAIKGYNAETGIVLIAARFFAEMSAQLRRLGYDGEIVQAVEYNSFTEYSLSEETLARKRARMLRGAKTLREIRALYPSQHLVVCPNNALGDVYWAMAFLPAYREKRGIGDAAVVTVGAACRRVAEMFGASDIVTLHETQMDEFVQAMIFAREGNAIIAHHDRPYTDNVIKWLDRHFLSFIDCYRYAVYGLDKDAQPTPPAKLPSFENREKIPQGRSVILSPYAKSVVELPFRFWERIADEHLARGYAVYTNAQGDEQPVRGTLPLSVPIAQMPAAAEHAGTFIGLRSGLCDVLFTANCRKTVVFPDCCYSTTPHKVADFFDLPGWKKIVCDNAVCV